MNKKLQSMYKSGGLLKALLKDPAQRKMAEGMLKKMAMGGKMDYGMGGAMKYRMGGKAMYENGGQSGPPGPSASQMNFGANTSPQSKRESGLPDMALEYAVVPNKYEMKMALKQLGYSPETIGNMEPSELRNAIAIAQDMGAQKIGLYDKRGLAQTKAMDPFIESGRVIANSYVNPMQDKLSGRDIRNQSKTAGVSDTYYDQYEAEEGSGYAAGMLARDLLQSLAPEGVDLSELEVIEPKTEAGDYARGRRRGFTEGVDPSAYGGLYNKYPGESGVQYVDPFDIREDAFFNLSPEEKNRIIREDQRRLGINGKRFR